MFTFSTQTGSQLHFIAPQFVAQQYEQVSATKLLRARGLFYESRDGRKCQGVNQRGGGVNLLLCLLTRSSNCPFYMVRGFIERRWNMSIHKKMCKREHYTFNKTLHITIPHQKSGCANFIIALFQLIKCMIIPWREIRDGNTTWQSFRLSLGSQACCRIMPFGRHFLYGRYGNFAQQWQNFDPLPV